MSVMRDIVFHPFTKLEVRRPSGSGWFSVTVLSGLVNLTFDLSTSKWGHRSPLSWASFLPIFILLYILYYAERQHKNHNSKD